MTHRKVFISILGTGKYNPCQYVRGDFEFTETRFIQKATLELLNVKETWTENDIVYIFLTDTARRANWQETPVDPRTGAEKDYSGLEPTLKGMNLPCPIETVDISEEGDEEAIWSLFETIYSNLQDGDELYIDITHSFRYHPMLLLVLCNYAKFLKQTKVAHISYGNWEAKTAQKPIVDLMPLVEVQDWSFAASEFLRNGRVSSFTALAREKLKPILKATQGKNNDAKALRNFLDSLKPLTQSLITVRGKRIIDGSIFGDLHKATQGLGDTLVPPMAPLIDKIKDSFADFAATSEIKNGFVAAQWCYDKQLYQQSITILQETLKGYTAAQAGYPCDEQLYQDLAGKAYLFSYKDTPQEKRILGGKTPDENKGREVIIRRLLTLPIVKKLCGLYDEISQLRNDFNHAGFRTNPINDIPKEIKKKMDRLFEALADDKLTPAPRLFLNLSNHPSADWSDAQRSAALKYGEIEDMAFPDIDPMATEEVVTACAKEYADKITEQYVDRDLTVHLMGEMTFSFCLLKLLQAAGIRCVASTTRRNVKTLQGGEKQVLFEFEAFRAY